MARNLLATRATVVRATRKRGSLSRVKLALQCFEVVEF